MSGYVDSGYVDSGYFLVKIEPSFDAPTDKIKSLDGFNGSYKDGQVVLVAGLVEKYAVQSSFFYKIDNLNFGIMYVLKDYSGKISYIPNSLLYLEKPVKE